MTEQHITVRKIEPAQPPGYWWVHTGGGTKFFVTTDEVRAMGLTLPTPPLTVTIGEHTATIGRDDAAVFVEFWEPDGSEFTPYARTADALADLIRTALEDQP